MHHLLQHCLGISDKYHDKWFTVVDFSTAKQSSTLTILGEIMQINTGNRLLSLGYYRINK